MAQASSANKILSGAKSLKTSASPAAIALYQQNAVVINRYGRWFLIAWLAALVDGKLLLAITTSTLTYHFLLSGQQLPWQTLAPVYQQLHHRLARLAQTPLLASSLAFATTYGFAAAWSQLGGSWAAITLLGLGAGNLLFFLREMSTRSMDSVVAAPPVAAAPVAAPESRWQDLSAADPLKRLLAVRSLLQECLSESATSITYLPGTEVTVRSHLVDCLRLMLIHESEPLVRVALIEGLRALHPKPQLPPGQPAISPLRAKPQPMPAVVQRSVEYVEP